MNSDKFASGAFRRSVGILAGGTAIAQALPLLALPIITRMYSPDDFAILAVFMAATQFISVIACLRLEVAIPLPEEDGDAFAVLILAIAGATLITGAILILILGSHSTVAQFLGVAGLEPFLWLIPVAAYFMGVYNAMQYWTTRKQRFTAVAKTRVFQSIAATGTQVSVGAFYSGPTGLVLGSVLQGGAGLVSLARQFAATDRTVVRGFNLASLAVTWRSQSNFPKYSVVEAAAQTAGLQLPIIIMASALVGPEVGYLALAMKVMQAPTTLIGSAISQVYISAAPEAARRYGLSSPGLHTLGAVLRYAAGPMIFGAVIGEQLFTLVFGPEWARAGEMLLWLAPLFIVHLAAASIGGVFYIAGRQRELMFIQLLGFAFRFGLVWIALQHARAWVVEVYAISGTIFYALYLGIALLRSGVRRDDLVLELSKAVPWVAGWSLASAAAKVLQPALLGRIYG